MERRGIELVWPGKDAGGALEPPSPERLVVRERHGEPSSENVLVHGDNLAAMRCLLPTWEGKVDLVAIDPPFATNLHYYAETRIGGARHERHAYADRGGASMADYLDAMLPRLRLVHRLLAPEGKLFLHCDWRANALLRLLLDEIFGPEAFRNEIVWRRAPNLGRQAASRQLGRVVDSIFVYSKTPGSAFRGEAPRKASPVPLDRSGKPKGARWDESAQAYFTTAPRGDYTDASVAELRRQNRIHDSSAGKVYVKYFLTRDAAGRWVKEQPVDTLWDDHEVRPLRHRPKREEMGYDTQKPEGLLERIVRWATRPGDVVMDVYAGSGTTLAVAERLGRRWLGCDVGAASVAIVRRRLLTLAQPASFRLATVEMLPGGAPSMRRPDGARDATSTEPRGEAPASDARRPKLAATVAVEETEGGMRLVLGGVTWADAPTEDAPRRDWGARIDAWLVDFAPAGEFAPSFVGLRGEDGTVPLATSVTPRAACGRVARVVVHTDDGGTVALEVPIQGPSRTPFLR